MLYASKWFDWASHFNELNSEFLIHVSESVSQSIIDDYSMILISCLKVFSFMGCR